MTGEPAGADFRAQQGIGRAESQQSEPSAQRHPARAGVDSHMASARMRMSAVGRRDCTCGFTPAGLSQEGSYKKRIPGESLIVTIGISRV